MKKLPYILFGGLVVAGAGIYFYFQYKNKKNPLLPSTSAGTTTPTTQINATTKPQAVASQLIPANNPVINYDGTLSGTVASTNTPQSTSIGQTTSGSQTTQQTQTIDPAYATNLVKANKAFAELMTLKERLLDQKTRLAGMIKPSLTGIGSTAASPFYNSTRAGISAIERLIVAKEKEIVNLGFRVIGNQLFAI